MLFSSLLVVAMAVATSAEQAPSDYTVAYKQSVEEEKPLLVMVGAEWCPACNVLKDTTLKTLRREGDLEQVSFVVIDKDAQPELAAKLLQGEQMIPRIIAFTKSGSGKWKREELKGYQTPHPVRSLIRRAIARRQG